MKTKTKVEAPVKSKKKAKLIIFPALLISLFILGIFAFLQYQKMQNTKNNPSYLADQLVAKVGRLISLPTNETPVIALVSDKNKLPQVAFYANAQNGDQVLIYKTNRKAYLYRPSTDKIIEVTTIADSVPATSPQSSAAVAKTYKLVLYNGTKIVGYTKTIEAQLKTKIANIEVVNRLNAHDNYEKTLIVDLNGGQTDMASKLASVLSASVSALPKNEVKPTGADFLVILGSQ